MNKHLALDTEACCLNDLPRSHTPCPHPLRAKRPMSRWMTHSPVWPSCRLLYFSMNERRWMQPNGTTPLFPLKAEEMRPGGGSHGAANHNLTVLLSIMSSVGHTRARGEESETADAALISVWLMIGEWVTGMDLTQSQSSTGMQCFFLQTRQWCSHIFFIIVVSPFCICLYAFLKEMYFIKPEIWCNLRCNVVDVQVETNWSLSTSFHLLGSHQGREVPSLQSHQETPEHTKKQHSYVTKWKRGDVYTVKMTFSMLNL